MKVLILGIDALEYDLVEERGLKNLKQKEHGKVGVPIPEGFIEPATVIVWPWFITEQPSEQMGYNQPVLYRWPFDILFNFYFITIGKSTDTHPEDIMKKGKNMLTVFQKIFLKMIKKLHIEIY